MAATAQRRRAPHLRVLRTRPPRQVPRRRRKVSRRPLPERSSQLRRNRQPRRERLPLRPPPNQVSPPRLPEAARVAATGDKIVRSAGTAAGEWECRRAACYRAAGRRGAACRRGVDPDVPAAAKPTGKAVLGAGDPYPPMSDGLTNGKANKHRRRAVREPPSNRTRSRCRQAVVRKGRGIRSSLSAMRSSLYLFWPRWLPSHLWSASSVSTRLAR